MDESYWLSQFTQFWTQPELLRSLPIVMDASSCREGWIQAEAFKFFRKLEAENKYFRVNTEVLRDKDDKRLGVIDFAAYDSEHLDAGNVQFVGELKVLGVTGYATKMLTGGGLEEFRPILEDPITDQRGVRRYSEMYGGGLLGDFFRLKDLPIDRYACPRFLMLLLDRRLGGAEKPNMLGEALEKLDFEVRRAPICDSSDFLVKIWPIKPVGR